MSTQLILNLQLSKAFVNSLIQHPGRYYKTKEQAKMKFGRKQLTKDGETKMRVTLAPVAFLKFKQRQVNEYLQKIILPNCMYGAVKGKNNIKNALQHVDANYFFTVDLKDFFTNISNKQVNRALSHHGFSWEDARIITKLCTSNRCLPQGAPTSSTLANISFASTAALLEMFCIERGIIFTVFVDDLTFSAKHDFSNCKKQILDIIRENGFFPNNKKIHYRHGRCEITGLIVGDQKLTLEKGMQNHLSNPRVMAYFNNVNRHFVIYQSDGVI